MKSHHILVVEDEPDILELIRYNLSKEAYSVNGLQSGEEALESIKSSPPDLIILDIMLPGINGFEVCSLLRSTPETRNIPIIMLTAKGEENDIISGLDLGANDYITKPFSPRILVARVKAALRKEWLQDGQEPGVITKGILTIDSGRHLVQVADHPAQLTATEFKILTILAGKPGRVFSRTQIINALHAENFAITIRAIDVQIVGLRKKLGEAKEYIETVHGVGYRFKE